MDGDKVFTQADLDAAVRRATGQTNLASLPAGKASGDTGIAPPVSQDRKTAYYHLYVCVQEKCYADANPQKASQHQRGVHTFSPDPLPKVLCPGCKKQMQIGQRIDSIRVPRSNPEDGYIERPKIEDLIYPAPGQEPAAELDEATIAKENGG